MEGIDAAHAADLAALVGRCAAAVHARGGRLAVYAPRRVARFTTTWNAAYDAAALAAADLVLASTYTESWERPGPMTTPGGLAEALDWSARGPRARIAPIVGAFGLRWRSGSTEPELVAQRDAEREAASAAEVRRDATGAAFATAGGDVRFTDPPPRPGASPRSGRLRLGRAVHGRPREPTPLAAAAGLDRPAGYASLTCTAGTSSAGVSMADSARHSRAGHRPIVIRPQRPLSRLRRIQRTMPKNGITSACRSA